MKKAKPQPKPRRRVAQRVDPKKAPQLGKVVPSRYVQRPSAAQITGYPALVLNADYTPLSYLPLSLWSWQDSVKAVFRETVSVLSNYENMTVRSPSIEVALPSVIVLKEYQSGHRGHVAFTRRNLFLRDDYCCQYCRKRFAHDELTYDHVVPRTRNGANSWDNVVSACSACNVRKGAKKLNELPPDMKLAKKPRAPTWSELQAKARARFAPTKVHADWACFIGDGQGEADSRDGASAGASDTAAEYGV